MRLVAVDAQKTVDAPRVLQTVAGLGATRVFLFGAAARTIAAHLCAEDESLRDRFLDDTAHYLMANETGPRPVRGTLAPFVSRLVAVVPPNGTPLPVLSSTDRAVEMRGTSLVMALPRRELLARENVENAALWLTGGAAEQEHSVQGASIVAAPGALDSGGVVLVVELTPQGTVIERRAIDGSVLSSEIVTPVAAGPRFSVRG
jgi:hypothetical protein